MILKVNYPKISMIMILLKNCPDMNKYEAREIVEQLIDEIDEKAWFSHPTYPAHQL